MSGPGTAAVRADVIVVAAGASRRMEGIDKLLAPIAGRPMLAWTLEALAASPVVARMVVVVRDDGVEHPPQEQLAPVLIGPCRPAAQFVG